MTLPAVMHPLPKVGKRIVTLGAGPVPVTPNRVDDAGHSGSGAGRAAGRRSAENRGQVTQHTAQGAAFAAMPNQNHDRTETLCHRHFLRVWGLLVGLLADPFAQRARYQSAGYCHLPWPTSPATQTAGTGASGCAGSPKATSSKDTPGPKAASPPPRPARPASSKNSSSASRKRWETAALRRSRSSAGSTRPRSAASCEANPGCTLPVIARLEQALGQRPMGRRTWTHKRVPPHHAERTGRVRLVWRCCLESPRI